jgi:SAM-dependent methyltransferase
MHKYVCIIVYMCICTKALLAVHAFCFHMIYIEYTNTFIYARAHPLVTGSDRIFADVCDVVEDEIPVAEGSQDLVLCMFVLSAIAPQAQAAAIRKLTKVLKPGGKLLIRDYGR